METRRVIEEQASGNVQVRTAAERFGVIERPPLARAMWKVVDIGEEIPESFYAAVAEILAYVYEINATAQRRSGDLQNGRRSA